MICNKHCIFTCEQLFQLFPLIQLVDTPSASYLIKKGTEFVYIITKILHISLESRIQVYTVYNQCEVMFCVHV